VFEIVTYYISVISAKCCAIKDCLLKCYILVVATAEIEYKHKYGSKVAKPDNVRVLDKAIPDIDQYIHECI